MTTYTIMNSNSGLIEDRGVSATAAAQAMLGYDGHEFEIRQAADGLGFELWISSFSRNSTAYNGLTKSVIFSIKSDREEAEREIFKRVIDSGFWTRPDVMTDEAYDRMVAEAE